MIKSKIYNKFSFALLLLLSFVFLFPIYLVVINSFKSKFNIIGDPFSLPDSSTFVGLENYIIALRDDSTFLPALWFTVKFAVVSVLTVNVFAFVLALVLTRAIVSSITSD